MVTLEEGSFFGESALMASCPPPPYLDGAEEEDIRAWRASRRKRNADVEALTFCYLFVLTAADFGKVRPTDVARLDEFVYRCACACACACAC